MDRVSCYIDSGTAHYAVNLGDISTISQISELENISVVNIGTDILGDIGRDFTEILISDLDYANEKYGRGMPAPSYHNLRVTLLKDALEDTKKFVDSFRPQWQKYGCSIMSDFWTDCKGRKFLALVLQLQIGYGNRQVSYAAGGIYPVHPLVIC
ncbi:zinc finger, CCHC-type containing protein [Tanacetum coccineum]